MQSNGAAPKRDVLDLLCTYVDRTLLVFKLFYFFFFAAFGSLFPLISVYFKQLGMNATQSGVLVGFRPFVEFLSAPFWGSMADRWRRGKTLLLLSVLAWIVFTLSMAFVKPKPEGCLVWGNESHMNHRILKPFLDVNEKELDSELHKKYKVANGLSPVRLGGDVINLKDYTGMNLVVPRHATVVYQQERINQVFIVLLVLMVVGEFFSSPAICLADSAVLNYLGDDSGNYGRQRMFGSLGWGLAMFFIGIALDHSTSFPDHPCSYPGRREKNYAICFAIFTVLMSFAMIAATQFNFYYDGATENLYIAVMKDKVKEKIFGKRSQNVERFENDPDWEQHHQGTAEERKPNQMSDQDIIEKQLSIKLERPQKDAVSDTVDPYADFTSDQFHFKKWLEAMKQFKSPRLLAFLFVVMFMGMGMGLVFTFLFWHLQDLGGSPTLFGIASVINHLSEILAYFFSKKLISNFGHIKVLYMGLFGNVCRFLYVSILQNPWWVLPFEFIQGLTHATVWAACISYITQSIPKEFRASSQGLLQGVHHGLGKGLGAVLGGMIISSYGSEVMFRTYGIISLMVLIAFLGLHYFLAEHEALPPSAATPGGAQSHDSVLQNTAPPNRYGLIDTAQPHEPTDFLEESTYLSPHGIPFAPSNRELSKSRPQEAPPVPPNNRGTLPPGVKSNPQESPHVYMTNYQASGY